MTRHCSRVSDKGQTRPAPRLARNEHHLRQLQQYTSLSYDERSVSFLFPPTANRFSLFFCFFLPKVAAFMILFQLAFCTPSFNLTERREQPYAPPPWMFRLLLGAGEAESGQGEEAHSFHFLGHDTAAGGAV